MSIHTLMFGWEYPPFHTGGLGIACQGIVQGLRHHDVRVTLFLPYPNEEKGASPFPEEDVCFARLTKITGAYASRSMQSHSCIGQLYDDNLGQAIEEYTAQSLEVTKHLHPHIVHCHDWMTYEAGSRSAKYHRTPLVAHIHATELDRTNFRPDSWIFECEQRGLLSADTIIAVSHYTKNILVQHYGIPPEKIHVIHNAHHLVDASPPLLRNNPSKHPPLVLFLGRLTVQKNPEQFLHIAKRVHTLRSDIQFVMAGDGPAFAHLIDRACAMGLEECMVFTGKITTEEVQCLFFKASCFVMPSFSEPFGLVALEAIAHGVPVILSKQSGASEVIRHGFIVDFWDADKMADCILTILRDESLARQLCFEAPQALRNLTWKTQTGQIVALYKTLTQTT